MGLSDEDGYRLGRSLGSGSVGSVRLARDLASGRQVVVKRVPAAVAVPEILRRDLALARGLDHPHVVPLLDVRRAEREWLLVSEYVPAGTLTDLLRRRGPLSTSELVTLLVPVAQALAAAHRAGLTHGHLGSGDILFTPDGRPQLGDLGLRSTVTDPASAEAGDDAGQSECTPADDFAALAALARAAGGDPAVFSDDLFSGDGTQAVERLLRLARPVPIALGFGQDPARPSGASHRRGARTSRRRRQARTLVLVAVAALVAGTVGGLVNSRLGTDYSPGATPSTQTPVHTEGGRSVAQWAATLAALDARRALAFATLDANHLDAVYARGSQPWHADRALLAAYRDRGVRVDGLRMEIAGVAVQRRAGRTVVLRVVDRFAGATATDEAGRRSALPAGQATTRLITLTGSAQVWRISAIATA